MAAKDKSKVGQLTTVDRRRCLKRKNKKQNVLTRIAREKFTK
jgi:hypothetical protein